MVFRTVGAFAALLIGLAWPDGQARAQYYLPQSSALPIAEQQYGLRPRAASAFSPRVPNRCRPSHCLALGVVGHGEKIDPRRVATRVREAKKSPDVKVGAAASHWSVTQSSKPPPDTRRCKSDVRNPFLGLGLSSGNRLRRKLKHRCFLTFKQIRQQHHQPIGKFQRIMMCARVVLYRGPFHRLFHPKIA